MGDALFGRYWAADSVIHRLDARTKVLATIAWVVACLIGSTVPALFVLTAAIVLFILLSKIPPLQVVRSVLPLMFIVVITALINLFSVQTGTALVEWGLLRITDGGLAMAGFVAIRLTLLLLGGSILTLTTTSIDITDALEQLLSPFARIGLPAHEFAMIMGIALRFVPQFADELLTIHNAQLSRGARLATSTTHGFASVTSLLVPLFASAFRHADTLSNAMDARCYHGAIGRTRLHPLKFAARDVLAAIVMVAVVAATAAVTALL